MTDSFKAVAWKKEKDKLSYTFQLSGKNRMLTHAVKEIAGKMSGKGFNPKTNQKILIIEKSFTSKEEWVRFVKSLTFRLSEISLRTGKERIINEG